MSRDSLKVLTIGNSFTDSLSTYFQPVVESAGCQLLFERANHGGCELHRHWSYIQSEEKDGVYRMYQDYRFKMREILAKQPWDVVTIQQASHMSWRPETYQPFANNIAAYVRQHAPQAELLIQQTWAYRADDGRFAPQGKWKYDEYAIRRAAAEGLTLTDEEMTVTQDSMYADLTKAYRKLSQEMKLRIIPTGFGVQCAREAEPTRFVNYDPALLTTLRWPDMPAQAGDIVGKLWWGKDEQSGELTLRRDTIHLNLRGEYMQACLWFAFLYEKPVSAVHFVPDSIGAGDAAMLRAAAQRAVDTFRQESF